MCGFIQMKEIRTSIHKYIFRCRRCAKSRKLKKKDVWGLTIPLLFSHNNPNYVSKVIQKYKTEVFNVNKRIKINHDVVGYCGVCNRPIKQGEKYLIEDGIAHTLCYNLKKG